jgi:hypothetical protein
MMLKSIREERPMKPLYEHDCRSCTFLGTTRVEPDWAGKEVNEVAWADWYGCTQGGKVPTIIARTSSQDSDYQSGWPAELSVRFDGRNPGNSFLRTRLAMSLLYTALTEVVAR